MRSTVPVTNSLSTASAGRLAPSGMTEKSAGAIAAYALSPIDLIPDFIPVVGYLDDLIIVPLGIILAVKLVPASLMEEFRAEATRRESRPASYFGLLLIGMIWIAAAIGLAYLFWPF